MSWGVDQDGNLRRLRVDEEGRLLIGCYLPAWETPVQSLEDLPIDDPIGTVRVVLDEPALYLKSDTGWEKIGASDFLSLIDTPDKYEEQGGKVLRVKATEDGIEFIDIETGATVFIGLNDVPSSYEEQGGKYLRVKATEDGIEFADVETGASAFIELSDVPSTYEGHGGKYLRVNTTEDGLEFATVEGGGGGGEPSYLTDDFGGM